MWVSVFYSLQYEPQVFAIPALILAVWTAWILVRAFRVPKALRDQSVCGVCSYTIGTVAQERCTECGTPLLRAGIRSRYSALKDRGSTAGALVAWTVLIPCIGLLGHAANTAALSGLTQNRYPVSGIARYQPIGSADQVSRFRPGPAYTLVVEIDASAIYDAVGNWSDLEGTASIHLEANDLVTTSHEFDLADPNAITPEIISALLNEAQLDPTGPVIAYESARWTELPLDWQSNLYQASAWHMYRDPIALYAGQTPLWMAPQPNPTDAAAPPIAGVQMISFTARPTTVTTVWSWSMWLYSNLGAILAVLAGLIWLAGFIAIPVVRRILTRRPDRDPDRDPDQGPGPIPAPTLPTPPTPPTP